MSNIFESGDLVEFHQFNGYHVFMGSKGTSGSFTSYDCNILADDKLDHWISTYHHFRLVSEIFRGEL